MRNYTSHGVTIMERTIDCPDNRRGGCCGQGSFCVPSGEDGWFLRMWCIFLEHDIDISQKLIKKYKELFNTAWYFLLMHLFNITKLLSHCFKTTSVMKNRWPTRSLDLSPWALQLRKRDPKNFMGFSGDHITMGFDQPFKLFRVIKKKPFRSRAPPRQKFSSRYNRANYLFDAGLRFSRYTSGQREIDRWWVVVVFHRCVHGWKVRVQQKKCIYYTYKSSSWANWLGEKTILLSWHCLSKASSTRIQNNSVLHCVQPKKTEVFLFLFYIFKGYSHREILHHFSQPSLKRNNGPGYNFAMAQVLSGRYPKPNHNTRKKNCKT